MTLHSRVMTERALGDALKQAFDAPPQYGGPKPKKKPKKKSSLFGLIKTAATKTARTMARPVLHRESVSLYDRVFLEAEEKGKKSFADSAEEYLDVSRSGHPLNKIYQTAKRWSDQGGALAGDGSKAPSTSAPRQDSKWTETVLKKPTADVEKVGSGVKGLRRLKRQTKAHARERWVRPEHEAKKTERKISGQAGRSAPPRTITGPRTSGDANRSAQPRSTS
jgi:hypothetical protein